LPLTNRVYLTRIAHSFNADTFFPEIDSSLFALSQADAHQPDEKNAYGYTFEVWERK
jgi:dihydrofolate reductase